MDIISHGLVWYHDSAHNVTWGMIGSQRVELLDTRWEKMRQILRHGTQPVE